MTAQETPQDVAALAKELSLPVAKVERLAEAATRLARTGLTTREAAANLRANAARCRLPLNTRPSRPL